VNATAGTGPGCRLETRGEGRYALVGDFGLESAAAVLQRGVTAFRGQPRAEVDLSGVSDADSAGLAVLIEWTRAAREEGRDIVFHGMPRRLAEIARIGGVDQLLPLDREQAPA
jgi:phospholipid transport system transporter-binding protein